MVRLKNCCCGFSLRTGIIMILMADEIIFGFFLMVFMKLSTCFFIKNNELDFDIKGSIFMVLFVEICIITVALFGAIAKKPKLLIPHFFTQILTVITYGVIVIIGLGICTIGLTFLERHIPRSYGDKAHPDIEALRAIGVIFILTFVVLLGVEFFFALVVFSYYKKLTEIVLPVVDGPADSVKPYGFEGPTDTDPAIN